MKVDGKTIGDERQFTIEEQFHDWFHEGLSAEDVSTKIKSMYEDLGSKLFGEVTTDFGGCKMIND